MELIRGVHNLRDRHRGCVLSIGNFDGFHLGHRALIERLQTHARQHRLPAAVHTFEPTPREVFARETAPGRVATFRGKLAQLSDAGVARVLCVRFGKRFAAIEAGEFVEDILLRRLGVRAVVVGEDFRFGAKRTGDVALLQKLGAQHGFTADALPAVEVNGVRVSSTAVREALAGPDLPRAAHLLGRPYSMRGRVRPGLKLGRKLGMPTANVPLRRRMALRYGIYVVTATVDGQKLPGVANIGVRPTLAPGAALLEVHVFGGERDLYGKTMDVEFHHYLRPERKFETLDALARQMQADGDDARAWFRHAGRKV